jgi:hypothetical protein
MLRNRTVLAIYKLVGAVFVGTGRYGLHVQTEPLHEFAFAREYPEWFLMVSRDRGLIPDTLKEIVLGLQDGRTLQMLINAHPALAQAEGQAFLKRLAADLMQVDKVEYKTGNNLVREREHMVRCLELDGYVYRDGLILRSESEAEEVEEERGELATLYASLGLADAAIVVRHLADSEADYTAGKWWNSIGNARAYLEAVLKNVAVAWSNLPGSGALASPNKAVEVRMYLQRENVLTKKEEKLLEYLYGILSDTGNHANVPEQEHARVFRRFALGAALYVLLRFKTVTGK